MDKVYRNSAVFIVLIILGAQWGFYKNYTSQFPDFKDATPVIHIHGAVLMAWLLMLVLQPILIATGRIPLHRKLGQISWVLGPAVILMLFLVGRGSYLRSPEYQDTVQGLSTMALDIRGLMSFAAFWALAMYFRKDSKAHMRYMLATGMLGIGPGVARGLIHSFQFSLVDAVKVTDTISLVIAGILLAIDIRKGRNFKPMLVIFSVFLGGAVLWLIRESSVWQQFAKWYAHAFYI